MLTAVIVATLLAAAPQTVDAGRHKQMDKATPKLARFTATASFSDGSTRIFHVTADRDSDNDGVSDLYELRVTCGGGVVASATISQRDSATGLATGRRQHLPVTRANPQGVDDWQTRTTGKPIAASWDLATAKGGRSAASAGPAPIALVEVSPAVCAP
ncbi:hypothetical protein [Sphingomonas sp.]|uniref:hypothetical protein n=1 Tax=Sphingomonas sp. TaxID=28214 RepID=UPI002DD6859C|nr:hypothetical protein [Sphingomonas sp.]